MPGEHRRDADIAGFAGTHDVVHRFHGFFDRGLGIEVMQHIDVDIIGLHPGERAMQRIEHMLAGMAAIVRAGTDLIAKLGGDHQLIALRQFAQHIADDFLARACRIEIGEVDEVNAIVERMADDRLGFGLIKNPGLPGFRAHIHRAEAEARYFQAGLAKTGILHGLQSLEEGVACRRGQPPKWIQVPLVFV